MIAATLLLAAAGLTQAAPFASILEKRQPLANFNDGL
jgi:hypothetical protein